MAAQWQDLTARRPDRYIDWEVLNRLAAGQSVGGRWCSVLVQCAPGPTSEPAKNLIRLRDEIAGRSAAGLPTIGITADEAALLEARIGQVQAGTYVASDADDPGLQFFVYLPEDRAYDAGQYAHTAFYKIRLVGPPIEGMSVNPARFGKTPQADATAVLSRPPGTRVAIGIIDDGIAFANERFRTRRHTGGQPTEETRIRRLWLQDTERSSPMSAPGVGIGTRLSADDINAAFRQSAAVSGTVDDADVYRRTGVSDFARPDRKSVARRASHGTHVMDLACGFAPDDSAGENRPIFAVALPESATADTSGLTLASYVLQGLRQIMLWADAPDEGGPLPLVVNFSYGILAGPKDGTHALEREIDRLVSHRNKTTPTAVVLPAGNGFARRTTANIELPPGEVGDIDWVALPDDATASFLEIWCAPQVPGPAAPFAITITPPIGPSGPPTQPDSTNGRILTDGDKPICGLYYDAPAGAVGAERARVLVAINPTRTLDPGLPTAPSGIWLVRITNTSTATLTLALSIQRDDTPTDFPRRGRQSYFDHAHAYERVAGTGNYTGLGSSSRPCPITSQGTLSAIGTGSTTVLVGAADAGEGLQPAEYTSSGPTPGKAAPDYAAIVEEGPAFTGVLAAGTASGSVVAMRGTSNAAPQITRRLADAGADPERLKNQLSVTPAPHPRLGFAVLPQYRPDHIPARRRT